MLSCKELVMAENNPRITIQRITTWSWVFCWSQCVVAQPEIVPYAAHNNIVLGFLLVSMCCGTARDSPLCCA